MEGFIYTMSPDYTGTETINLPDGRTYKISKTWKDIYVNAPAKWGDGDGIRAEGNNVPAEQFDKVVIFDNCTIDLSDYDNDDTDENISVVYGCNAIIRNCTIIGGKKLCLVGNGDTNSTDKGHIVVFENCTFENGCRRCPEVQAGYKCYMYNCTIKNWSRKKFFDVRGFGTWIHDNAEATIENCKFIQDKFWSCGFLNFFVDLANHIGQSVNDEGIKALFDWKTWIPGSCRGAIATNGGKIKIKNCTKNHWWIYCSGGAKLEK